ncbi:hypothetical protein [Nocardiopsis algeriensis]|uniref:Uncharacterized protein n=1 Tax=Nocardiopsis algeriensis TaxID=1478215 RepID=A0A841IPF0_9ACTN|nr:hypothetical protein [Nocardiopsis algeriensis]MBB6119962.1 hypothetical protein [Nocardiopsis algeriensis]
MSAISAAGGTLSLPRNRAAAEPLLRGPRKVIAGARSVAGLLEQDPALWPCLTTCVTDTDGRVIVHYAASGDSGEAACLFGPDGVVARWRSVLTQDREARRERDKGRERVVTVHGHHCGHPVTVLFTVIGAHP